MLDRNGSCWTKTKYFGNIIRGPTTPHNTKVDSANEAIRECYDLTVEELFHVATDRERFSRPKTDMAPEEKDTFSEIFRFQTQGQMCLMKR